MNEYFVDYSFNFGASYVYNIIVTFNKLKNEIFDNLSV